MRPTLLIVILAVTLSAAQSATVPTVVNPECQSLADIINDIKRRLDQIPLSLLPIPGLNASLPTTLKCHEYSSCTGFNCSGTVYGTHIQFSFNFDYCVKPISANISLFYPAENVTFIRRVQHAKEFFITKFSFKVPVLGTTIELPVQLYGKIDMVRGPGRVIVSAGIIPKFNILIPVPLQAFNILTNQTILIDTSRCNGAGATGGATVVPSTPMSTSQASTTMQSATTVVTTPTPSTPSQGLSTTEGPVRVTEQQPTNQAIGSGALSGGEVAAVVMGVVALITIVIFVILFMKKRNANTKSNFAMDDRTASIKTVPPPESTYFGTDNVKTTSTIADTQKVSPQSTYFGEDNVKASVTVESVVEPNPYAEYNEVATSNADSAHVNQDYQDETKPTVGTETIITSQFEVHIDNDKPNANEESAEQFQF